MVKNDKRKQSADQEWQTRILPSNGPSNSEKLGRFCSKTLKRLYILNSFT